ncbi:hypothetical protein LSHI6S_00605 [Leifsonia shinshuensis]
MITGLSAGGATRQGLERALELCDTVDVVFDASGPTFHPKVYFLRDGDAASALVGSHNLTPGGLFRNVEAGIEVRKEEAEDEPLFSKIDEWLDSLVSDSAMTVRLDASLLDELVSNPRFRIGDESIPAGSKPVATENVPDSGPFTKSKRSRRYAQLVSTSALEVIFGFPEDGADESAEPTDEPPTVLYLWSKKLSRSEALRPNPGSNVTGVLRLGKAGWDVNVLTYFRELFFGSRPWALADEAKGKYVCTVDLACTVDGVDLGVHTVTVDFMAGRVADQSNVPTVLHWGTLSSAVRDTDHIGSYVVLRAFSDGTFSLEIKHDLAFGEAPGETGL